MRNRRMNCCRYKSHCSGNCPQVWPHQPHCSELRPCCAAFHTQPKQRRSVVQGNSDHHAAHGRRPRVRPASPRTRPGQRHPRHSRRERRRRRRVAGGAARAPAARRRRRAGPRRRVRRQHRRLRGERAAAGARRGAGADPAHRAAGGGAGRRAGRRGGRHAPGVCCVHVCSITSSPFTSIQQSRIMRCCTSICCFALLPLM